MLAWLWESMQWNDVVDIGIMSYLLYRALLVLKGTRALQSLVGLIAILGLYVFAEQFELVSLHWLLEKFLVYIVLAIIILFQKDIRRGLAGASGRLFVGGRSNPGTPPSAKNSSRHASPWPVVVWAHLSRLNGVQTWTNMSSVQRPLMPPSHMNC